MRRGVGDWDEREWTEVAGTRVHAALMGSPGAPDVVLVHGLGCSHRYFRPLARALAGRARVAAVDLPGFGWTDRAGSPPDVRTASTALGEWLTATGRRGAVIAANSAGCHVVVDLAARSPEAVGRLVLNGPAVDGRSRRWTTHAARLARTVPREPWRVWPVIARDVLSAGPVRVLRTFRHLLGDPIEANARRVVAPAVMLRGTRDPVTPRRWAEVMCEALPRGRLVEVDGAAHVLHWSHSATFADVVAAELRA